MTDEYQLDGTTVLEDNNGTLQLIVDVADVAEFGSNTNAAGFDLTNLGALSADDVTAGVSFTDPAGVTHSGELADVSDLFTNEDVGDALNQILTNNDGNVSFTYNDSSDELVVDLDTTVNADINNSSTETESLTVGIEAFVADLFVSGLFEASSATITNVSADSVNISDELDLPVFDDVTNAPQEIGNIVIVPDNATTTPAGMYRYDDIDSEYKLIVDADAIDQSLIDLSVETANISTELDIPIYDNVADAPQDLGNLVIVPENASTTPGGLYRYDDAAGEYQLLDESSGFVSSGNLSDLNIDADKPWGGYDITDVGNLSADSVEGAASGTTYVNDATQTVGDGTTTANHQSVNTGQQSIGPLGKEVAPRSVSDQIVVSDPSGSAVAYYDATGDFGQAINDAWAAAPVGGYVKLPGGRYTGSTTIVPQSSGVKITGLGGEDNQDASIQDATGTVYAYSGAGRAFDVTPASTGFQSVIIEGVMLEDADGAASTGWYLDTPSLQNGVFRECYSSGFKDGWYLGSIYHYDFKEIYAFRARDNGIRATTDSKIACSLEAMAFYCDGTGINIQGFQNSHLHAYSLSCGVGVGIGTARGNQIIAGAETCNGRGIDLFGGTGNAIQIWTKDNAQSGSGYEFDVKGGVKAEVGGRININNHTETIRIQDKFSSIEWHQLELGGSNGGSAFFDWGGVDHTFPSAFPVEVNAGTATDGDSDNSISLSFDVPFSSRPSLNYGRVSGGVTDVSFTTDADGNYNGATVSVATSGGTIDWSASVR